MNITPSPQQSTAARSSKPGQVPCKPTAINQGTGYRALPGAAQLGHMAPDKKGHDLWRQTSWFIPKIILVARTALLMDALGSSESRFLTLKAWIHFIMMSADPYFSCQTCSGCTGPNSCTDFVKAVRRCCSEYSHIYFFLFRQHIGHSNRNFRMASSLRHPTHKYSKALISQPFAECRILQKPSKIFLLLKYYLQHFSFFFLDWRSCFSYFNTTNLNIQSLTRQLSNISYLKRLSYKTPGV